VVAVGCTLAIGRAPVEDGGVTRAPEDDVAGLVERARGGDRGAFGALYERFAALVHGLLLARVAPGEVRDLAQDVFLAALRSLPELREPGRFGAWLAEIARSRATDHARRRASAAEAAGELDERAGRAPAPDAGDAEQAAWVLAEVRRLPEAYRETLVLRLVEGMSGPEIAARCGMTPGSVRVNLHRGMALLRQRLAAADPDGAASERREARG